MIGIVIPTFNERVNIGPLLEKVFYYMPHAYIVVVDDNSPDGTAKVVETKKNIYSNLHLIVRTNIRGRGGACVEGFLFLLKHFPKMEYIIEMDSDFSHNPKDIPRLLKKANEDTIVVGSRYVSESRIIDWPKGRLILSRLANMYIRLILGLSLRDVTMGFRCYSRKAFLSIDLTQIRYHGFITLSEIAYLLSQKNFQFVEVPITLKDRTKGRSNATVKEIMISFVAVLSLRLKHS